MTDGSNVTVLVHEATLSPRQVLLDALADADDLQDIVIVAHRKSNDAFDSAVTAMPMFKAVAMAAWGADYFMRRMNDGT